MNFVLRSALAGAATGGRTFTGLAALAVTAPPSASAQPDRALAQPATRGVVGVLALTELVMDKLPQTPSRLDPPGFGGRLVFGALCGAVIARRAPVVDDAPRPPAEPPSDDTQDDPRLLVAAVVTAAAAAAGASWLGVQWRAFSSRRLGPSWVGAVLEDAAVIALAAGAAR